MATKSELEAKIAKAKANSLMPEALKAKYIAGVQKELDALEPKAAPKKASKATMEKAFGKEFMKSKDKGALKTYPAGKGHAAKWTSSYNDYYENVIIAMEESGDMTTSDAQGVADPHENWLKQKHNDGVLPGAAAVLLLRKTESPAAPEKKESKKAAPKKPEPAKPAGKKGVDYDCDELIEKEKARQKSSKKSAAKSPAKKSGDTIEKTGEAIEKKVEEGELTKDQILQLIQKFKKEIRRLEKLLKTAK